MAVYSRAVSVCSHRRRSTGSAAATCRHRHRHRRHRHQEAPAQLSNACLGRRPARRREEKGSVSKAVDQTDSFRKVL